MKLIFFIKQTIDRINHVLDKAYVRGHYRTINGERVWVDQYYDKRTLKKKEEAEPRQKKRVNTTKEELLMRAEQHRQYLKELETEHETAKTQYGTRKKLKKGEESNKHFYGEHSIEEVMANFDEQKRRVLAKIKQIESDIETHGRQVAEREAKKEAKKQAKKPVISEATQRYIQKLRSPDTKKFAQDYANYVYGISDKEPGLPEKRQSVYQDIKARIDFNAYQENAKEVKKAVPDWRMGLSEEKAVEVQTEIAEPKQKKTKRHTIALSVDNQSVYEMEHEIVDLYDLIPSHKTDGSVNSLYNQELQPRNRGKAASAEQIADIAARMQPLGLVLDFMQADRGCPVIGSDGMVESGNGRTLALMTAVERKMESWVNYQNVLKEHLDELGLSESDLEGKKYPVLVRRRITGGDDLAYRKKFAQDANHPPSARMSRVEVAESDAKLFNPRIIDSLVVADNDSGNPETLDEALRKTRNHDFVMAFVNQLPLNERTAIMLPDGRLGRDGIDRIKAALYLYTFPPPQGERLAYTFFEAADSTIKTFEASLTQSLSGLCQAEALMQKGVVNPDLSLMDDIAKSMDKYSRLKDTGLSAHAYTQMRHLKYGEEQFNKETTAFQDKILNKFEDYSRSPAKLRRLFAAYSYIIDQQSINAPANQKDLQGYKGFQTKEEVWEATVARAEELNAPKPKAKELF